MPVSSHDEYATWVATQLKGPGLDETPGDWTRRHIPAWREVFAKIVAADAVLELPGLVVSRWEYLGSLYRGHTGERTGCEEAVAFSTRFLEHVNPLYRGVHNLTGRNAQQANQSDIYMMIRNKPLHGASPAAIQAADGSGVVTWWIAAGDTGGTHLAIDPTGRLHVNGTKLYEELLEAMKLFADYLDQNTKEKAGGDAITNHLPQERWLRAAWARFKPHGHPGATWMARGIEHGIPTEQVERARRASP
jgi:hypothetical protein